MEQVVIIQDVLNFCSSVKN